MIILYDNSYRMRWLNIHVAAVCGIVISSREPHPGVDSIVRSPLIERTHSLITNGPFPSASSSARQKRPENGKPRPSSSIVSR